jgi:hypothetical protein
MTAGSSEGISISLNFGLTWTLKVPNNLSATGIRYAYGVCMSATGQYQFVANAEGAAAPLNPGGFISQDYGATWKGTTNGAFQFFRCAMTATGQTIVTVSGTNPSSGTPTTNRIMISNDYGVTWANSSGMPPVAQGFQGVGMSATGQYMVVGSVYTGLYTCSIPIKTFVIDHPKASDKYLVHACLEGPEAAVYYRGKGTIKDGTDVAIVSLPDYVDALATNFTILVSAVFNGTPRLLNHSHIENNQFKVYGLPGDFHWHIYGLRQGIAVEVNKANAPLHGDGPYKWLG